MENRSIKFLFCLILNFRILVNKGMDNFYSNVNGVFFHVFLGEFIFWEMAHFVKRFSYAAHNRSR